MPAFALFFPVGLAVALSAVVHMLNNLFKLALMGRYADRDVTLRFGVPAIIAAFCGAALLVWVSKLPVLTSYQLGNQTFEITGVKLVVAVIMITFALIEVLPQFQRLEFDRRFLPLGGLISGFFGGLTGHQGAMRAAFLIRRINKRGASSQQELSSHSGGSDSHFSIRDQFLRHRIPTKSTHASLGNSGGIHGFFCWGWIGEESHLRTIQLLVAVMLVGIAIMMGLGLI